MLYNEFLKIHSKIGFNNIKLGLFWIVILMVNYDFDQQLSKLSIQNLLLYCKLYFLSYYLPTFLKCRVLVLIFSLLSLIFSHVTLSKFSILPSPSRQQSIFSSLFLSAYSFFWNEYFRYSDYAFYSLNFIFCLFMYIFIYFNEYSE